MTLLPCSRFCSRGAGTWQAAEGEGVRWIGNACSSSAKTIDIEGGRRAGGRLSPSLCISLYLSGTKKGKEAVASINTGAKPRSKTLEQAWNKSGTAEHRGIPWDADPRQSRLKGTERESTLSGHERGSQRRQPGAGRRRFKQRTELPRLA